MRAVDVAGQVVGRHVGHAARHGAGFARLQRNGHLAGACGGQVLADRGGVTLFENAALKIVVGKPREPGSPQPERVSLDQVEGYLAQRLIGC